jgi:hypothetical protein
MGRQWESVYLGGASRERHDMTPEEDAAHAASDRERNAEWMMRLIAQAHDIEALLREAGVGACPLVEGVQQIIQERDMTERFMRHQYGASGYVAPAFVPRELAAGVTIGGNHLASALHLLGMAPAEWRLATYDAVLTQFGQPVTDIWVCWKAIMDWTGDE